MFDDWSLLLILALAFAVWGWRAEARRVANVTDNWYDVRSQLDQLEAFYFTVAGERPHYDARRKLIFDYTKDQGCYVAPELNKLARTIDKSTEAP